MSGPGSRAAHIPGALSSTLARRRLASVVVLSAVVALAPRLSGQAVKPTEYEVQAAYLSNFGRFVEWPARSTAAEREFEVCVLGQDPFVPLLDAALKGEVIRGVPMVAKRVNGVSDAAGCRIVYINPGKDARLKAILDGFKGMSVLTVSDNPGFTKQGGMIQFVLEGNRVRFEINLAAAQQAGLTLSSELLKVAVAIRRAP
jgi:YfiR/HmsC-like